MPATISSPSYEEAYEKGIETAIQRGEIQRHVEHDLPDTFSHLSRPCSGTGLLTVANTRHLSPLARAVLLAMLQSRSAPVPVAPATIHPAPFRYLESGFGAGVSAYDAFRLAAETKEQIEVLGIALTPINPHFGLRKDIYEILAVLPQHILAKLDTENVHIPLERLLRLEAATGPQCFDILEKPFMARQHIGRFPDHFDTQSLPTDVDFIHDDYGPLEYAPPYYHALELAYQMLGPEGLIFIERQRRYGDGDQKTRDTFLEFHPDLILAEAAKSSEYFCIFAKVQSLVARILQDAHPEITKTRKLAAALTEIHQLLGRQLPRTTHA